MNALAGASERAHDGVPDRLRQRRGRPSSGMEAELGLGLHDDDVVVLGERPGRRDAGDAATHDGDAAGGHVGERTERSTVATVLARGRP